jgi:peptide/nickel transport system permease protein
MDDATTKKRRSNTALRAGIAILAILYLTAILAEFLAPYDYREQIRREPSAPPSTIRFRDLEGTFHPRPFIYAKKLVDPRNLRYEEDTSQMYPIAFFVSGYTYTLCGVIPATTHLFGVVPQDENSPRIHLLGTDQLGRDRFSRLMYATRFSLVVSPIGTALACLIGIVFGAISGYANRSVDTGMMGVADTVIALPTLILILAARAAFPLELPPFTAASLLIAIFALTGWAEMARLARGEVVAVKQREYILAARSIGLTETRILWRHVLPNITSPLVTQATLMLPAFFLAEIALSFLGVGLQEPEPSLGNLLTAAGDITQLARQPFVLLSPAIVIFLFVFATRLLSYRKENI